MTELEAVVQGQVVSRVLIIDDAFDDLDADTLDRTLIDKFIEIIDDDDDLGAEREASGLPLFRPDQFDTATYEALAAGAADQKVPGLARAFERIVQVDLADRANVRALATRLSALPGVEVKELGSKEVEADQVDEQEPVDYVFLDYYLGGPTSAAVALSVKAAKAARAKVRAGHPAPMLVLMSSRENVADQRADFKRRAEAVGATFFFLPKKHLDDEWKVASCIKMLEEAKPYADTVEHFVENLSRTADAAFKAVVDSVRDLELADYSYLQQARLLKDGHPLGEYLAWLLSHHVAHEWFEKLLSDPLRELDKMMIQEWMLSQRTPSKIVGELYQSAVFERGLPVLGPHPRHRRKVGEPDPLPHLVLGDVFRQGDEDAVVVLSAACDLATGPDTNRTAKITSVLLVPGKLVSQLASSAAAKEGIVRTDVFPNLGPPLAVDWNLNHWFSVPFAKFEAWLGTDGYDVLNRARLRPLFALSLQHSFHAHRARVGVPKSPPFFHSVRAELWWSEVSERQGAAPRRHLGTWSDEEGPSLYLDENGRKRCMLGVTIATAIRQEMKKQSRSLSERLGLGATNPNLRKHEKLVGDANTAIDDTALWDRLSRRPLEVDKQVGNNIPVKIIEGGNPRLDTDWMGIELHINPIVLDESAE